MMHSQQATVVQLYRVTRLKMLDNSTPSHAEDYLAFFISKTL